VIERLSQIKQLADLHCSTLIQGAVHEFCQRGALDNHLDRVRGLYRQRRDAMLAALRHAQDAALTEHGPAGLEWDEPQGGFNLWCRLPPGLKARQLMAEAARRSVALVPGEVFYPDGGGQEEMRLNFSCPPIALIEEGVQRLGAALTTLMRRRKREEPGWEVEVETQPIV
jgi:2-aminoadipate transaminase